MQKYESLLNGNFYHVYNCRINEERLFRVPRNHKYFLCLYERYVELIADTFV